MSNVYDRREWTAQWIRAPWAGGTHTTAPAPYFRHAFNLEEKPSQATLHITALGLYVAHVNGQRVGDQELAPGWTNYHKRVAAQQYDVGLFLDKGENVLTAVLGDGWYCGYVGLTTRQRYGDRPELLCELELLFPDGRREIISSGPDWKVSTGPIIENDLFLGETYDERKEEPGWTKSGFDDSGWSPVQTGVERLIDIAPRLGPPVRAMEELSPVSSQSAGFSFRGGCKRIFDFGQNMVGRLRLRFQAPAGADIAIHHAEVLDADGKLYTQNLRRAKSIDRYTCARDGWHEWEPLFTFHGFRYVQVDGLDAAAECELTGVVLYSDMPVTGEFSCSNPLLNQLTKNVLWGQKGNFVEVPTDCPQRDERLGWTGDSVAFCRTGSFFMDAREFYRKWLRDLRDDQCEDGGVPEFAPFPKSEEARRDSGPAWADAAVVCPWTVYLCYGDRSILEESYDSMKRFMDFRETKRLLDGICHHPDIPDCWSFGDWLALDDSGSLLGRTPMDLIGTAYLAHDAGIMAKVARVLDKPEDASHYEKLRHRTVAAFQRRFVTGDGLIVGESQTGYVLALAYDLLPPERREAAVSQLVGDIEKRGMHLATGFVGTPHILRALEEGGRLDIAYALLEQETYPSWLFPVTLGATTIWERWDGWHPERGFQDAVMNSFNHYAYGAVAEWMVTTVAGLDLDEERPGYERIVFRPRPGGSLDYAQASLETRRGRVSIHWKRTKTSLSVTVEVPEGAEAVFSAPGGWAFQQDLDTAIQPGQHQFEGQLVT